jgi:hypothetical protein
MGDGGRVLAGLAVLPAGAVADQIDAGRGVADRDPVPGARLAHARGLEPGRFVEAGPHPLHLDHPDAARLCPR